MNNSTKNFDEGFDNILTYDYDSEYMSGNMITADSLFENASRESISLNGEWHFSPDVFKSVVRSRWFDETKQNRFGEDIPYDFSFEEWECVDVPGVWNNVRTEYALYEGSGLYFKKFSYEKKENKRVFLRIGAANYETRIWLNKKYLGRHLGGFTPFVVEISDYICEKNRLLICVDNTRKGEQIPSMHYDWFNYGGIHRGIELIETDDVFVKSFNVQLEEEKNSIAYYVRAVGNDAKNVSELKGKLSIPELGIDVLLKYEQDEKKKTEYIAKGSIEAEGLSLWSINNPKLYKVDILCETDCISDNIGFRIIETDRYSIKLNGEDIFLKGMCVHEEYPESLRAATQDDIEQMIISAKELGCNFLRLTHYPHNEMVSRIADRLGIMLLEEIPVYWALEFENENTYNDAANQLEELIKRDINRASVIIWSIGNENPDTEARYSFMRRLAKKTKELDDSRLIGASCLIDVDNFKINDRLISEIDVIGINEYYGWYLKDFETLEKILVNSSIGKPLIITETGADAVSGKYSEEMEIYSEEYQALVYQKQFNTLLKYKYIRGITPWILYDYASMRRMSVLQKGYNLKGIISADRKHKKKAYYVVKEIYSKL